MHSATAPKLSCWGRAGHQAQSPCSFPQAPSTPGKERTIPRVAANKDNNAVVFMGPSPVRGVTPSSPLCSLQPEQGRNHAPVCPGLIVQGYTSDAFPSLLGTPRGAAVCQPAHVSAVVLVTSLTGCSPPTLAVCGSGAPPTWRSAACPWSSPAGWAAACSRLSGTVPSTPPATSCGSACLRSRTPAG